MPLRHTSAGADNALSQPLLLLPCARMSSHMSQLQLRYEELNTPRDFMLMVCGIPLGWPGAIEGVVRAKPPQAAACKKDVWFMTRRQ